MPKSKVKWGILGVAKIAVDKVIPAMQQGQWCEITAIASRDKDRAEQAAGELGIPKAYGSYDALLADPEIEAIYNPLPNHLHVPWSVLAANAGKHVLCEKPLSLTVSEARELIAARDRNKVMMGEAFMVRTHPQWIEAKRLIHSGEIGTIRAIQGAFSYFNRDPLNVRNIADIGGGGILDIGCYPITTSRFVLDAEPARVFGVLDWDPDFKTDRLASAILDFGDVQSSFVCGTQHVAYQRMHFFGTEGRVEIEIPFNAPPDRPCRIFVAHGNLFGEDIEMIEMPVCDQYTLQGDIFSRCIQEEMDPPVTLEDAVGNMAVIEALFRSSRSGKWEIPTT